MDHWVSVIIPTFRSEKLHSALEAIAQQTALDRVSEVLVVGQQEMPVCPGLNQLIHLASEGRSLPGRNRNLGAQSATSEWLLSTDSDCIPKPDWVEQILKASKGGSSALGGAVDVPNSMGYWGRCVHYLGFESQAQGLVKKRRLTYAATLNFAIRRDLFIDLGSFDEAFSFGEDREFGARLSAAGYQIEYVPDAVVVHNHPRDDFVSAWRRMERYGEAPVQYRLKYIDQAGSVWKLGRSIVKQPVLGELAGLTRILLRGLARPVRQPRLLRSPQLLPGIGLLDMAHTAGMIRALRSSDDYRVEWID